MTLEEILNEDIEENKIILEKSKSKVLNLVKSKKAKKSAKGKNEATKKITQLGIEKAKKKHYLKSNKLGRKTLAKSIQRKLGNQVSMSKIMSLLDKAYGDLGSGDPDNWVIKLCEKTKKKTGWDPREYDDGHGTKKYVNGKSAEEYKGRAYFFVAFRNAIIAQLNNMQNVSDNTPNSKKLKTNYFRRPTGKKFYMRDRNGSIIKGHDGKPIVTGYEYEIANYKDASHMNKPEARERLADLRKNQQKKKKSRFINDMNGSNEKKHKKYYTVETEED